MKNLRTPLAVLLIVITAASCRKTETQFQQPEPIQETSAPASLPEGISQSDWQQATDWNKVEQPSHSVFFSNINAAISTESAEQGLIRVFKLQQTAKDAAPKSLPFEETIAGQKYYWYYQVTEGNVMIALDVYGAKAINPADQSLFKFVVVSKSAVSDFEGKGISRADLMDMSLDKITGASK